MSTLKKFVHVFVFWGIENAQLVTTSFLELDTSIVLRDTHSPSLVKDNYNNKITVVSIRENSLVVLFVYSY